MALRCCGHGRGHLPAVPGLVDAWTRPPRSAVLRGPGQLQADADMRHLLVSSSGSRCCLLLGGWDPGGCPVLCLPSHWPCETSSSAGSQRHSENIGGFLWVRSGAQPQLLLPRRYEGTALHAVSLGALGPACCETSSSACCEPGYSRPWVPRGDGSACCQPTGCVG